MLGVSDNIIEIASSEEVALQTPAHAQANKQGVRHEIELYDYYDMDTNNPNAYAFNWELLQCKCLHALSIALALWLLYLR